METLEECKRGVCKTRGSRRVEDIFPGWDGSKEQSCEDAVKAFRYFGGTGRIVVLEEEKGEFLVFMNPKKIVDFERMVTEAGETIWRTLMHRDAQLLSNGLLSKDGQETLWQK